MALAVCLAMALWMALGWCSAQTAAPPEPPSATFGVTVIDTTGLEGKVYHIKRSATKLPNFQKMKPRGSIYTTELNIPPRHWLEGFPGVTRRFEWFAIDYAGRFWTKEAGLFRFALVSDDGARLYIDDTLVIDNDGVHAAIRREGSVQMAGGAHRIRVSYFQGPRDEVALILQIAPPGQRFRVFSTRDFRPPPEE